MAPIPAGVTALATGATTGEAASTAGYAAYGTTPGRFRHDGSTLGALRTS